MKKDLKELKILLTNKNYSNENIFSIISTNRISGSKHFINIQTVVYRVFICSSLISLLWAFNVSKIALSDLSQKIIYALGAGTGAVTGLFLVKCFL